MQKHFLIFYLNTGAGHKSAATALRQAILERYPSAKVTLTLGYDTRQFWYHLIFEKGYHFSSTVVPPIFSAIIKLFRHRWVQHLAAKVVGIPLSRYIRKVIRKNNVTDVISVHFLVTPSCVRAVRRLKQVNPKMNLSFRCIVTDPFAPEAAWFYSKNVHYDVFSERARNLAIQRFGIPEENVAVMPFILNKKYSSPPTPQRIAELRKKYGFPDDRRILLLAGGGEGLPHATAVVNACLQRKNKFALVVVCGRSKVMEKSLKLIAASNPSLDLHVFGFVDYMEELIAICDCAVIKAGPATLMEVLRYRKPVIICSYIKHEMANIRFARYNKVGWLIRKPTRIIEQVEKLFTDDEYYAKIQENLEKIQINTDLVPYVDELMKDN